VKEPHRRIQRGDDFILRHDHVMAIRVPALDLDEAGHRVRAFAAFDVVPLSSRPTAHLPSSLMASRAVRRFRLRMRMVAVPGRDRIL
jgi:hypothetical protein